MNSMGVHDEVDHSKPGFDIEKRETHRLSERELDARDQLLRGGNAMRSAGYRLIGASAVFYYKSVLGGAEMKCLHSLDQVPMNLSQSGSLELTKAAMRCYGVTPPGEKKDVH